MLRVSNPMDLKTLLKKVVAKNYRTIDSFLRDLSLIYENCVAYNGADHLYSKISQVISEEGHRLVKLKFQRLELLEAVISENTAK
jgi:Bromodomain